MVGKKNCESKFINPFVSLKHRNFRYYWLSMCVSLIGTWMQNTAQPWLAYTLTKSPFLLSLIGILQFTPMLLFSLFAGVVIDRMSRKKILLITQSASFLITLVLAFLVWSGDVRYWHLLVSAVLIGFVNTLDMPARQAFVIELVGKEDLQNAVALNSSVFNIARVIGPAIAGLLMSYMGIAFCFFANSIGFVAVVICLMFVKPSFEKSISNKRGKVFLDIKDGLCYIYKDKSILHVLSVLAIICTFAMNTNVLVPVFTKEVLHRQEAGFGFLMSFMGIGSFFGAMLVATTSKSGLKKYILSVMPVLIGVFLIINGLTNSFLFTGLCLAVSGFLFVAFSSTSNSTLQLSSSDEYRGRIISVYTLVFSGSTPIGNLYSGLIADKYGARVGFVSCGVIILILVALLYYFSKDAV